MKVIEKSAITKSVAVETNEPTTLFTTSIFSHSRIDATNASVSENSRIGIENVSLMCSCRAMIGSLIELITCTISRCENSLSLLKINGMNIEKKVANTTHISPVVIRAATPRGMYRSRIFTIDIRRTSGRPMMPSTAEIRI